ncbi:hypothetical protein [Alteribacter populi]|uniref:hypothetical protein n=1 Tax=Alteribacter populi TaxID=2011011 RepID=UPI000BBB0F35|nr:hypothetical protein [Alteribacter populi]
MYFLNHRYRIKRYKNIFFIEDSHANERLLAFKIKDFDFNKLKRLMYFGTPILASVNKEEQVAQKIIQNYKDCFTICESKQQQCLFLYIREYTNFFRSAFISNSHYQEYIDDIETFIKANRKMRLVLALNGRYSYLQHALIENPVFDTTIVNDDKSLHEKPPYDLIITESFGIKRDEVWQDQTRGILFLNSDTEKLSIGPLVFTSKFEIPDLSSEENSASGILPQEEQLIHFFIERILFIYTFKLNDKLNKDCCLPVRHRLILSRLNLQGYSQLVTLYPRDTAIYGANHTDE